MKPIDDLESLQKRFAKKEDCIGKKTLVLSLDDCLVRTGIFTADIPHVDGIFENNGLKIFVSFRPSLMAFLSDMKPHFELIIWSSSQEDFTKKILELIDTSQYFSHILDISHC